MGVNSSVGTWMVCSSPMKPHDFESFHFSIFFCGFHGSFMIVHYKTKLIWLPHDFGARHDFHPLALSFSNSSGVMRPLQRSIFKRLPASCHEIRHEKVRKKNKNCLTPKQMNVLLYPIVLWCHGSNVLFFLCFVLCFIETCQMTGGVC